METKRFTVRPEIKADKPGVVVARFATFNVIDKDGDVTIPGAFGSQQVRMQPYGHNTGSPSIGKGVTRETREAAFAEMQINLAMASGREVYESLKFDFEHGEPLQEFSYIFDVLDAEPGVFQGQRVRFLKRMKVHSVDPVFLGAGIGTVSVSVKSRRRTVADCLAELDALGGVHTRRERLGDLIDEAKGHAAHAPLSAYEQLRAAKRAVGDTSF